MVNIDFFKLAVKAAKIADDKKAIETVILDVKDLTTIANYFVVTTAESAPQINAISGDIEKTFKSEDAVIPVRREGISSSTWRVIDYGGLVVHVMSPQVRASYNLESIWREAKIININAKEQIKEPELKKKKTIKAKVKISKKTKKVTKKPAKKSVKKIVKSKLAKKAQKTGSKKTVIKASKKISRKKK
ncbi:ribosome silencing factor [Candidatus Endomicrobiellum devescovinae]|jgi:ribosome-associated protein|uniref:ribosome silencing factor n=1 Tax=Candidatus Endomicrobiellum devescovinae TaxID=3242322 RepID=UPI00282827F8|nr:ribosome silencing factor [Endomicrobium sp.]